MIEIENLGNAVHIYSTENKKIKCLKTGSIHSEYVVKKADIKDYVEVENE